MHRASMAHNECGWKRGEGAARTEVGGENCRHVGIDKNGLLMEAAHASQRARSLAAQIVALNALQLGSRRLELAAKRPSRSAAGEGAAFWRASTPIPYGCVVG
jgi:hypothetical protein